MGHFSAWTRKEQTPCFLIYVNMVDVIYSCDYSKSVQYLDENRDHYTSRKQSIPYPFSTITHFYLSLYCPPFKVRIQSGHKNNKCLLARRSSQALALLRCLFLYFLVGGFPPGFWKQKCYFIFFFFFKWLPLLYSLVFALSYAFDVS